MRPELEGWQRYAVVTGGVLLSGAVCAPAIRFLVAPSGSIGPTMLQAQSAFAAIVTMLLGFGLATAVGAVVGRLVNAAVGLFVVGAGLWAVRLRSGGMQDLVFGHGSLGLVIVETVLWGLLILGATHVVFRYAGPLTDIEPPPPDDARKDTAWTRLGLRGLASGVLVIPVVWFVARSDLKGQTLMAVVLAGMVVGLAGRLLSPHAQPRLLFAVPCFFGAAGQIIGMLLLHGPMIDAFVGRSIPALSLPMPIDYAAGSLTGVAMGLGWAKSFLQPEGGPQRLEA